MKGSPNARNPPKPTTPRHHARLAHLALPASCWAGGHMLVLTRRVGESIRIGDHIRLTVRGKVGGHISVALAAPAGVIVTDDTDTALLPCRRVWRRRCYEATLLLGDSLRIGRDVVVWIGGGGQAGLPAKSLRRPGAYGHRCAAGGGRTPRGDLSPHPQRRVGHAQGVCLIAPAPAWTLRGGSRHHRSHGGYGPVLGEGRFRHCAVSFPVRILLRGLRDLGTQLHARWAESGARRYVQAVSRPAAVTIGTAR